MAESSVLAIQGTIPQSVLRAEAAVVDTVVPLTVLVDGVPHPAYSWLGGWAHSPNDRVLVLRGNGRMEVVGTGADRPASATVTVVASGKVTVVDGTGRTISGLPHVGTAPGIGATVALGWGSTGGYVVGVLSAPIGAAPATPVVVDPDPPAPPTGAPTGVVSAAAAASATARSGSWRTDGTTAPTHVMQGHWTSGSTSDNTGFYFFGRALQVAGATAVDGSPGTVRLRRDSRTGMNSALNVGLTLHAAHTKPGSPPALLAGPTVVGTLRWGQEGTFPLPDGWAQQLLDGTAGGLGIASPGTAHYLALTGPTVDPVAALVSIPYTRE